MGLFEILTGKTAKGDEPTGLSPWQAQLRQAKRQYGLEMHERFEWSYENATARALVTRLLAQAAPAFGNAQVREAADDGDIELHGSYEGAPIRFCVTLSSAGLWSEMMCENPFKLYLTRDHTKIPKAKDPNDPWAKNEGSRLFVGKGIFVDGSDQEIATELAAWSVLPAAVQEHVVAEMERMDLNEVAMGSTLHMHVRPSLDDLAAPIDCMQSCARLMAELKRAWDAVPLAAGGGVGISGAEVLPNALPLANPVLAGAATRLVCTYCSSLFVLAVGRSTCPNCGAPATKAEVADPGRTCGSCGARLEAGPFCPSCGARRT